MPEPQARPIEKRPFVLALWLLIGVVAGFVLLLSRLPLEDGVDARSGVLAGGDDAGDYEFYTALAAAGGEITAGVTPRGSASVVPVMPPATRTVPGSARRIDRIGGGGGASGAAGSEAYYLQAGSFGTRDEAERARASLLLLGLDAFVVTRVDGEGRRGHRVRVGPFVDAARFAEARERLHRGNVPYDIVRVTG